MGDITKVTIIEEHFDLLAQKESIESAIKRNSEETVKVLVNDGAYDLLTVNWTKAHRFFIRHT